MQTGWLPYQYSQHKVALGFIGPSKFYLIPPFYRVYALTQFNYKSRRDADLKETAFCVFSTRKIEIIAWCINKLPLIIVSA